MNMVRHQTISVQGATEALQSTTQMKKIKTAIGVFDKTS
jgi:hypothetical protein